MTKRKRRLTGEERADWRCCLCGRKAAQIGVHPLPVQQRAHLLPNRLTGGLRRYGRAKNPFSDTEWQAFLKALGPELRADLGCDAYVRETATAHCYDLCGECHEEVLSEPVYLPSVMRALQKHFRGASRVEKVVVLTRMLKRGAEALELEAKS